MDEADVECDLVNILFTERQIQDRLRELAVEIEADYQGKDILRASGLPALPLDNVHVASDLAKVQAGRALSPVLLVRGDAENGVSLQIADGYHRVCAAYHLDENTDVPCRIVGLAGVRAAAR